MRPEHKSHVTAITFAMGLILVIIFALVLMNHSWGSSGVTTSLYGLETSGSIGKGQQYIPSLDAKTPLQNEIEILVGLLILLVFLALVYAGSKVVKEIRSHRHHK